MDNLSVIGLQWGDEGKGKIVDCLSQYVDIVTRFQGGNNAGHTLVINSVTYKLNLLPSGIVREGCLSIIDQGVVIDPYALIEEINNIPIDITKEKLMISEDCHLILSVHKQLDTLYEKWRADGKIGTTCKGIGPCYEDKVARRGIRICDIYDKDNLLISIRRLLKYHNALRKGSCVAEIGVQEIVEEIQGSSNELSPYIVDKGKILDLLSTNKVLFEGAQGCLLDVSYGTYPFVTSGSTIKANCTSDDNFVLGVAKAYTTRVGSGPFPTEQDNDIGKKLQTVGKEIGTVSGRARRCGWFDLVLMKYAIQVSGTHGIALTKLDVLDCMDTIKICTHYKYNSRRYDYFPSSLAIQKNLEPVYEELSGWKESTHGVTSIDQLPKNAITYIKRLEDLLDVPIVIISTGANRDDIIMMI